VRRKATGAVDSEFPKAERLAYRPGMYRLAAPPAGVDRDAVDRLWNPVENGLRDLAARLAARRLQPGEDHLLFDYAATAGVRHPSFEAVTADHQARQGLPAASCPSSSRWSSAVLPAARHRLPQPAHPPGGGGHERPVLRHRPGRHDRRVPVRLGQATARVRRGRTDRGVDPGADVRRPLRSLHFGLSTDYEVFLISRMHEEWTLSEDSKRAVIRGQAETGRVITAASLIMILVFATFILTGQEAIMQIGLGFAACSTSETRLQGLTWLVTRRAGTR